MLNGEPRLEQAAGACVAQVEQMQILDGQVLTSRGCRATRGATRRIRPKASGA